MIKIYLTLILTSFICCETALELISPEDGGVLNFTHVLFQWSETPQIDSYQLQISNVSNFSSIVVDTSLNSYFYIEKKHLEWSSIYYWRVRTLGSNNAEGDWLDSQFSIGQNSESFTFDNSPIEVIVHNENLIADGIVIFGSYINQYSAAIDKYGNEVWNSGGKNTFVYFNNTDDGELLGGVYNNNFQYSTDMYGGSININGDLIFVEDPYDELIPNSDFLQHEIIKLPNGNYLSFAPDVRNHPIPQSGSDNIPYSWEQYFDESELLSSEWLGDRLIEWDSETGDTVWTISTFDFYSLNDFDILGDVLNSFGTGMFSVFDWTHCNAIGFDAQEEAIYISSRHLSKITKLDYNTREIIWHMGLDQAGIANIDGSGNTYVDFTLNNYDGSLASFSFQHGIQVLENGNIVTLDNGNLSGYFFNYTHPKSRALEIAVDEENASAQIVWEYILPDTLYGQLSGNVQKLYNGNYFITVIADGATSIEVTPEKEVVWECKYNLESGEGPIYRASKIPELIYECPVEIDECGICGGDGKSCLLNNNVKSPSRIHILSIYPNPFNPRVSIAFSTIQPSQTTLNIYNIRGELITTILNDFLPAGEFNALWDGSQYPAGIYFVQLNSSNTITSQKLMLLK